MFSIWKAEASRGRDEMTISRSSLRIRCTQSIVVLALLAGSTVKTWSLETAAAVKPAERHFGVADLVDDALAALDESGVGVGHVAR
jgi:hypothetical protein